MHEMSLGGRPVSRDTRKVYCSFVCLLLSFAFPSCISSFLCRSSPEPSFSIYLNQTDVGGEEGKQT